MGLGVLIAGGGLALVVALVGHFASAVSVSALAAPTWTDGLGLALLGIVYVPNAVVAGAGYLTGVGFVVGPGTYSPFSSSIVELPAVPLLAATPDHSGVSLVGIALMLVPLLAGGLIGWRVVRRLSTRQERVYACRRRIRGGRGRVGRAGVDRLGRGRRRALGDDGSPAAADRWGGLRRDRRRCGGRCGVGAGAVGALAGGGGRCAEDGKLDDAVLDGSAGAETADDEDELLDADGAEVDGLDTTTSDSDSGRRF